MARKVRIIGMTPLVDGDIFDISGCVAFSVKNAGITDATFGYEGNPNSFSIVAGDTKVFGHLQEGLEFDGRMEVLFSGGIGKLEVTLIKAKTEES